MQAKSGSEWPAGNIMEYEDVGTQAVTTVPSILGNDDAQAPSASPVAKQLCSAPSLGVIQEDEEDKQIQRSSGSSLQDIQVRTCSKASALQWP